MNYDFPPHHEDYVHRIGRTGRAQAIGEAISFVTSEDHGSLRALERFIGRGIVRKKAEGFDMGAKAPPRDPNDQERNFRGGPRGSRGAQGPRSGTDRPTGNAPRSSSQRSSSAQGSTGRSFRSGMSPASGAEAPKKPGRRPFMGFGRNR